MDRYHISLHVDDDAEVRLHIAEVDDVALSIGTEYISGHAQEYDGPHEFTPTYDVQIAHTANRLVTQDVIINPIPNNYGLITWDGSALMVS